MTTSELNILTCANGELCGWLWSGVQLPPVSCLFVPLGEQFCVLIQVPGLGTASQECMGTFEKPKFVFVL